MRSIYNYYYFGGVMAKGRRGEAVGCARKPVVDECGVEDGQWPQTPIQSGVGEERSGALL